MAKLQKYRTGSGQVRYVAVVRVKGLLRTSRAFATRQEAKDWAERMERQFRGLRELRSARAIAATLTVRQLVERFLADPILAQLRWRLRLDTLLSEWTRKYGATPIRCFGSLQVETFRARMLARERATETTLAKAGAAPPEDGTRSTARADRCVAAMRLAWKWGMVKGYVPRTAPWPAGLTPARAGARKSLPIEAELGAMLAACDAVAPELGTLVRFMTGTGARLSAALELTWRDVDRKADEVMIRTQKTAAPLRMPMLAPARDAIARAAQVRNISGRVFWQYADRRSPRSHWARARRNFPARMQAMRLEECRRLRASLRAAQPVNGASAGAF